ncbi:MAG: N-acetyltransferase [Deltaproteobacteria bacterium HGW-Deltaproteobacteria-13]|jgi:acetyltransferase-like isoleucine patch superfamily enzyme|nr:MAG: N-acetyltransferase [Deltaproteobacteria bacterium HGW-Deltaproteobacteria-13]
MSVFIHPSAEVHKSAEIGDGTYIWNNVQIRENTKIGKNCIISKGVYIDIGVKIGNSVKIQNGVSVYAGVEIEDEVFVGPNATFTNDMYPRATARDWKIVPTKLRFGCSIGANATIVCGVVIGPFAMVAAGAVVTNNVPPFALMTGNPSRLVGFVCKKGHPMIQTNAMEEQMQMSCPVCGEKLSFTAVVDIK